MTYRDRLFLWCIIQSLPKCRRHTVAKFRKRSEAEEYLQILRRLNSQGHYTIVFDDAIDHPPDSINPPPQSR